MVIDTQTYLGEKVVSEKEYLSAMLGLLLPSFWSWCQMGRVVLEEFFGDWRGWMDRRC